MKSIIILFFCSIIGLQIQGQSKDLNYYLPDISYDDNIPTPQQFLGYQVGDWHVSHDQLHMYMRELAEKSDRIELEEYARSHENRPLLVLKITSASNHARLEEIRQEHLSICDPGSNININDQPVVVYQGYSIHGNEPSGANASLLVAYYLAAGQGSEIENLLDSAVILLDPSFNPDGLHRFSTWANMHKSKNMTPDPASREYNEIWPRGRTNHYWFDLNRDWLLLTHPESRGRVALFHRWKPNILTDHHEMGTNSTFFFMPGIPSRTNPNTPQKNQELTGKIAEFHAKALDKIGSLYYSKESFDDFYFGKGSTYPDGNGCIGILFEQASSRGHLQESANGILTFPFTIRNQVATSLSTQAAAVNLRSELLKYQQKFYRDGIQKAKDNQVKAYVFECHEDPYKLNRFIYTLQSHQIDVFEYKPGKQSEDNLYQGRKSYVVPLDQNQYTMVKTLFEKMTQFEDSLFYDVSAWTLPLAYDINYAELRGSQFNSSSLGKKLEKGFNAITNKVPNKAEYGYLIDWRDYLAPKALYNLLDNDLRVKVMKSEFSHRIDGNVVHFKPGTLLIPVENQDLNAEEIYELILSFEGYGLDIYPISSGEPESGIFMGSPQSTVAKRPEILIIIGNGVNGYEAGAAWHQLDQNFGMRTTAVELERLGRVDLSRYNTILMSDGNYGSMGEKTVQKLTDWVSDGGNLIAVRRGVEWAMQNKLANIKKRTLGKSKESSGKKDYDEASRNSGSMVIGGAIFEAHMDLSHPLCYGYSDTSIALFKRDTRFYENSENPYATPITYKNNPLLSGYMSKKHNPGVSNSAAAIVCGKGSGTVICLMDNPNFRGYWWGSSKLFANAIFMSQMISNQTKQR